MMILGYFICGIIFELFLINEQVEGNDVYDITIMDLFTAAAVILLWPGALFIRSFSSIISFNKVLFTLRRRF